ncbi:MAG: transposase [Acetobacteraceae bacterium]|nr:transposase [Acetobacteraceae bacterium]
MPAPNALFNLSKLAVWWLRLGVQIERIRPGRPQQNGRHERMPLTLTQETIRPPGMNILQQLARFDDFLREFNIERPHEALDMKCPTERYSPSARPYDGLPELEYPLHDREALGHPLWSHLHASQKDQYFHRARRPEAGHRGSR